MSVPFFIVLGGFFGICVVLVLLNFVRARFVQEIVPCIGTGRDTDVDPHAHYVMCRVRGRLIRVYVSEEERIVAKQHLEECAVEVDYWRGFFLGTLITHFDLRLPDSTLPDDTLQKTTAAAPPSEF